MVMALLQLQGLTARYGKIQALSDVTLEVRAGEIVTLIGANGAGKSTTLRAITRMITATTGSLVFDGQPLDRLRVAEVTTRGVIHVPEGRRVFARMSVLENLELGAYLRHDKVAVARDIEAQMERFPILGQRRHQPAGTLSGGEQQMLAMARALMGRPRLLLLDEPSMGLAPLIVRQIMQTIVAINREGLPVLLVEQNARQALAIAHRGYVLEHGKVGLSGTGAELLASEDVRQAYLGAHADG
ncbi:MAG: ABC transporter ATP-binding protein [Candidatus Sericytochromatia bacterium]|nr:ABC transporter ATP-binding protein [Candidatus Tanganyikabacteria bacterium]